MDLFAGNKNKLLRFETASGVLTVARVNGDDSKLTMDFPAYDLIEGQQLHDIDVEGICTRLANVR